MVNVVLFREVRLRQIFSKYGYEYATQGVYGYVHGWIIVKHVEVQRSFLCFSWTSDKVTWVASATDPNQVPFKLTAYSAATEDDVVTLIGILKAWEEETGEKTSLQHRFVSL